MYDFSIRREMLEFGAVQATGEAKDVLIADIGSIVSRNEIIPGRDPTGQVLALAHRAHPAAVDEFLQGYRAFNPAAASGNVSAFVRYWLRKAQKDVAGYQLEHPWR